MKMNQHETKNDLREKTRRAMIDLLNQELADVLDLGLQAKQAHWNVKGPHFIGLHELFDKVADCLLTKNGPDTFTLEDETTLTLQEGDRAEAYGVLSGQLFSEENTVFSIAPIERLQPSFHERLSPVLPLFRLYSIRALAERITPRQILLSRDHAMRALHAQRSAWNDDL